MRKLIIFATLLLLVQVGLVVVLNLGNKGARMTAVDADFLGATAESANNLTITDGEGKSLELVAKDGKWQMPASQNSQADSAMVSALLEKLGKLKQGFTEATSDEAAKRFKVAVDDFERHVVLQKDGSKVADFYIGTSPGFRQVHARKDGESSIVSLALSTFEFDTDPAKWLDKTVLQVKTDDMKSLKLQDIVLTKKDKDWTLEGNVDGELDKAQVDDLLGRVATLSVEKVIAAERAKQLMGGTVATQLVVELTDGRSVTYDFVQDDENSYAVKRSDLQLVYGVHKIVVDGLLGFSRDKLLKKEVAPQTPDAGATPDGAAPVPEGPAAVGPAAQQ